MQKHRHPVSPSMSEQSQEKVSSTSSQRSNDPFIDSVRQRAYELYEKRVADHLEGDPMSDWLQAEKQIRGQSGQRFT